MLMSYKYLRPVAIFAGVFGIIQSLAWIGMAITGIIAYYCNYNFSSVRPNLGTSFELTFFKMYFQGTCENKDFPTIDFSSLDRYNLMKPIDVHSWMWVYLVFSFFWMISSFTLITNITMEFIKYANIFLYIWIFLTLIISVLDLAIGVLFANDYNTITIGLNLFGFGQNPFSIANIILLNAKSVAGVMLTMAFRGFLVWIINVALLVYFFTETFKIYDHNKMKFHDISEAGDNNSKAHNGTQNMAFSEPHSMLRSHPIDAYAFNRSSVWPNDVDPQKRERTQSISANSYDDRSDRKRPYEHQQQPIQTPQRRYDDEIYRRDPNASIARELKDRNSFNNNGRSHELTLPIPDYSPPMPRAPFDARPPLRSALRTTSQSKY